jgi:hypothetical protein
LQYDDPDIFSFYHHERENLANMSDIVIYASRSNRLVYEMQNLKACGERPVAGNGSVAGCVLAGGTGE